MIKKEWFKTFPKWKMFFVRLFGKKITTCELDCFGDKRMVSCVAYRFRGETYIDSINLSPGVPSGCLDKPYSYLEYICNNRDKFHGAVKIELKP